MVNSEVLGKVFEPCQRFEAPDGTDLVFDADYLGNHRGPAVLPGPFASAESAGAPLFKFAGPAPRCEA